MSESSLEELASAAARRLRLLRWGVVIVSGFFGGWLALDFDVRVLVAAVLWVLAISVKWLTLRADIQLETTKSPEAVREAFTGPDNPLFALNRGMVDTVTEHEQGMAWERSGLLGTSTGRFEAVNANGDIDLRLHEDGEHVRSIQVAIKPRGSVTRVTVSGERQANVFLVLYDRLLNPLLHRALSRQGYVVVADETSIL